MSSPTALEGPSLGDFVREDPYAVGVLGICYAFQGPDTYEPAVANLDLAIRLSPNDPWLQFFFAQRGVAEFLSGHDGAAIE